MDDEVGDAKATKFKWPAHGIPCHETIASLCFFVPSPIIISPDFVKRLVSPLRGI
jgi:hypothetical protein